jgi:hypothetical protein
MRRPVVLLALVFVAILAAMAAAPLLVQPPPLRTANAPDQFDAVRAKARLGFLIRDHPGRAERPHPADSLADDGVRERLIVLLRGMGLQPIVRDQSACNALFKERGVACARVRNVIVVLGPGSGKALLLNAHYDSTAVGPGAADDGVGVATLLEVGAKLKGRPLKRPVMLLFNEGEELGLVGARAFLADPLSRDIDSLINLEARGVRGPVNMFETSRPNAAPIALFASAVKHPVANSLSTDVYRLMPNYTDVNSFSERGWLTLNLAPIGNETRYHSAGDDIAALDPATLQHMGDQTLALALGLSNGTPTASGNRLFMDVSGRSLITLPLSVGVVLLALLLLAFAGMGIRRGGFVRSAGVIVGTLAGSGVLAWLALAVVGAFRQGMFWRAEPRWTLLGTYALAILVGTALLATLGRRRDRNQLRPVLWLLFLALGAVVGLFAPGAIVFFLFPPLLALAGVVLARWWGPAEGAGSACAILFLYLTWGMMLALLEELLNGGPMWLFAPLGALLILPVLIEAKPLIDRIGPRAAAAMAGLLALIGWAAAAAAPAYSAERQQRFVIQHVSDADSGKHWWSILNDGARLPPAAGRSWTRGKLPLSETRRWLEPAPPDPTAHAPAVRLVGHVRSGTERSLLLRLAANGNQEIELIAPESARIRRAGVPGFVRPIDQSADGRYFISCSGRACDGMIVELVVDRSDPLELLVVGSRAALPPSAAALLAARPRFARPQYTPDASIAFRRVRL